MPPGFRQRLAARGVLGIDVLPFTRDDDGGFLPPAQWRHDAVAMTTTHDLPTLAGWRIGRDLSWRRRCGLLDADGRPRAELFLADGLHLNAQGYALWRRLVGAYLGR